jgi:hypothetical protein
LPSGWFLRGILIPRCRLSRFFPQQQGKSRELTAFWELTACCRWFYFFSHRSNCI